jgi:hypothetical protein
MPTTEDFEKVYMNTTSCETSWKILEQSLGYHDAWASIHVMGPAMVGVVMGSPLWSILSSYLFESWQVFGRIIGLTILGEHTTSVDSLIQDPLQGALGSCLTWAVLQKGRKWVWNKEPLALFRQLLVFGLGLGHYVIDWDVTNKRCQATFWGPVCWVIYQFETYFGWTHFASEKLAKALLWAWFAIFMTSHFTYLLKEGPVPLSSTTLWLAVLFLVVLIVDTYMARRKTGYARTATRL